jgi:hypothetical protein
LVDARQVEEGPGRSQWILEDRFDAQFQTDMADACSQGRFDEFRSINS